MTQPVEFDLMTNCQEMIPRYMTPCYLGSYSEGQIPTPTTQR
jgi:hypothetical protein